MVTTYDRLHVCRLTPEQHARTCGYWYTVQSRCTAHTAFATRAGLDRWLSERGLTLTNELPAEGDWCEIIGSYRTDSHLCHASALDLFTGLRTRTLSNGDYVEAVITTDEDGLRTVHTLNPNVRNRFTFDYRESETLMS